jgi:hypothetical protein
MDPVKIALTVKKHFGRRPDIGAAIALLNAGVSEQDVTDACRKHAVADPDAVAVVNAMRDIKRARENVERTK